MNQTGTQGCLRNNLHRFKHLFTTPKAVNAFIPEMPSSLKFLHIFVVSILFKKVLSKSLRIFVHLYT